MQTVKLDNVMIGWNPNSEQVRVGAWPDQDNWSSAYKSTGGACYTHVRSSDHNEKKLYLFILAMHMIVRDGVDPKAVHKALLAIDEYRDGLSDDVPGVWDIRKHEPEDAITSPM